MGNGQTKFHPTLAYYEAQEGIDEKSTTEQELVIPRVKNTVHLDVSNRRILRLSSGILAFQYLRSLDLSRNSLVVLPPELCMLTNLHRLDVSWNQLTELPKDIGLLSNLIEFKADYNKLKSLPPSFYSLTKLLHISVQRNQIVDISPDIIKIESLVFLHLDSNPIVTLPSTLGLLPYLRHLTLSACPLLKEANYKPEKMKIPSLKELAARMVVRHSLEIQTPYPAALLSYLGKCQTCTACRGPLFETHVTRVRFVQKNGQTVPLQSLLCSEHWTTEQERIAFLFYPQPYTAPRPIKLPPREDIELGIEEVVQPTSLIHSNPLSSTSQVSISRNSSMTQWPTGVRRGSRKLSFCSPSDDGEIPGKSFTSLPVVMEGESSTSA